MALPTKLTCACCALDVSGPHTDSLLTCTSPPPACLLQDSNDYAGFEPLLKAEGGYVPPTGTKKVRTSILTAGLHSPDAHGCGLHSRPDVPAATRPGSLPSPSAMLLHACQYHLPPEHTGGKQLQLCPWLSSDQWLKHPRHAASCSACSGVIGGPMLTSVRPALRSPQVKAASKKGGFFGKK